MVESDKPFLNKKILLAEDNEVNRAVAIIMLQKLGAEVTSVVNGREALEKISQEPFHLIFMDCQMPEMDGYEASRHLKQKMQDGEITTIPIIAMTAHAMIGDRQKCIEAGMDDYISKPTKKQDLMVVLERWLG